MGRKRQETIGKKFNKLTVISEDDNNRMNVIVRCECGNIKSVDRYHLVHNEIYSCNKGKCHYAYSSMVGKKFFDLTVIEDKGPGIKLLVRCKCEVEFNLQKGDLITGHTKSCGNGLCNGRIIDLSNKRFGKLVAISFDYVDKHNQAMWKCQCDCGKILIVKGSALTYGNNTSCGCMRSIRSSQTFSLPLGVAIKNTIFSSYRSRSIKVGKVFELSFEDFITLIESNCHYCGIEPCLPYEVKNLIYEEEYLYFNGVDRKDNDIGYTYDNCVACCWPCNFAKGTVPYLQFLAWRDRIADFCISQRDKDQKDNDQKLLTYRPTTLR